MPAQSHAPSDEASAPKVRPPLSETLHDMRNGGLRRMFGDTGSKDGSTPEFILDVVMLKRKNKVAHVHREYDRPVSDEDVRSALDSLNKQVPG